MSGGLSAVEELLVEGDRRLRDPIPVRDGRGLALGARGESGRGVAVLDQLGDRLGQRLGILGWHEPRRPALPDLREAAHRAEYERATERQGRVEDARLLDVPIREDDQIGTAHEGRYLGIRNEPIDE